MAILKPAFTSYTTSSSALTHQPLVSSGSGGNPIGKCNKTQSPEASGEMKRHPHYLKS